MSQVNMLRPGFLTIKEMFDIFNKTVVLPLPHSSSNNCLTLRGVLSGAFSTSPQTFILH